MTTYKNRLPQSALMGYISPAPHKTGAGITTLLTIRAHNRASGFFTCKASSHLFRIMVGRTGPLSGGPGSLVAGCGNPVRLTTPEITASCGELFPTTRGYPSWQTVNNAALTRTVSTRKPKSNADSNEPIVWHLTCHLICYVCHTAQRRYGCRQFWTISPTISAIFRHCLTGQRTPRDLPENLTQKQHSACWWGVCLHDMQEALSP
ncbi:ash family protein [Salmonella enterica]|nr:ash family protein [Salmonella enterica]EKB5506512.1 ash family protein [Salmonella enterica]EKC2470745.1 ash family protein [Salmonella enterica]EKC2485111.1 ash family protein [Salmonella enterica]EKC2513842.1 ash family protein [Salmonella enterica]